MTDKERILTYIFTSFYPRYVLDLDKKGKDLFHKCNSESIQIGDLVLGTTSGIHDFTIGYVVKKNNNWSMNIREIGGESVCELTNEQFYKIDISELDKNILLEGECYIIYENTKKALDLYADDSFLGGKRYFVMEMEFDNDFVTVYLRKKWDNYVKNTAPIIKFNYKERASVQDILQVLYNK